jgi:hypothetical protein
MKQGTLKQGTLVLMTVLLSVNLTSWARGQAPDALDGFFADEVWAKVGERTCLNCHHAGGEASESRFVLRDLLRHPDALAQNRAAFERVGALKDGKSKLLFKVVGELDHGGGAVLKRDSTAYRILERYVRRLSGVLDADVTNPAGATPASFFDGVRMASPQRLLRRVTLSLAGRLPTPEEREAVEQGGLDAVLDGVMKEEAFYVRLKEGFNDIFLTQNYADDIEGALGYAYFQKTMNWIEKYDLSHVAEKDRQQTRWDMGRVYRKALLGEPLELVAYIVRNDRPFTEIVTADYFMVSPYSARGYGIFESVRDRFKNPEDLFEYIPAKLPALKNGDNGKVVETPTGLYPSAGLLSQFQYLRRWPTTETNRNRLRARMYYQQFLGVDIMALAPRVADAAAISAKYKNPVMEASDCVACHRTIDPVAGLFQDYFNERGNFGPREQGWFTDVFPPGRDGEDLPASERWRALQWLGEQTAKDPRFATAMAEHVYYILVGRRPLLPPQDIDDPLFTPRRRAYLEERREIQKGADALVASGFNLKSVFKSLIASPFYRVDGLATATDDARRRAELDDMGLARMLTPEQLERKIAAVFGERWGRFNVEQLDEKWAVLYGGIDSKEVTQRLSDPSGPMGALQRLMANQIACKHVPLDFSRPPSERRLFPGIEPDVVPGSPEAEAKIRRAIVHLHEHVLGRLDTPDDPEVERTYRLFSTIVEDARSRKDVDKQESYYCRPGPDGNRMDDPHYTLRAWRAVVTYLLRQHDFLYE